MCWLLWGPPPPPPPLWRTIGQVLGQKAKIHQAEFPHWSCGVNCLVTIEANPCRSSVVKTLRHMNSQEQDSKDECPPLLPPLTRARFSSRGQKGKNTGSLCSDKPMVPRGTYHGTHVADISQPYPFITTFFF